MLQCWPSTAGHGAQPCAAKCMHQCSARCSAHLHGASSSRMLAATVPQVPSHALPPHSHQHCRLSSYPYLCCPPPSFALLRHVRCSGCHSVCCLSVPLNTSLCFPPCPLVPVLRYMQLVLGHMRITNKVAWRGGESADNPTAVRCDLITVQVGAGGWLDGGVCGSVALTRRQEPWRYQLDRVYRRSLSNHIQFMSLWS